MPCLRGAIGSLYRSPNARSGIRRKLRPGHGEELRSGPGKPSAGGKRQATATRKPSGGHGTDGVKHHCSQSQATNTYAPVKPHARQAESANGLQIPTSHTIRDTKTVRAPRGRPPRREREEIIRAPRGKLLPEAGDHPAADREAPAHNTFCRKAGAPGRRIAARTSRGRLPAVCGGGHSRFRSRTCSSASVSIFSHVLPPVPLTSVATHGRTRKRRERQRQSHGGGAGSGSCSSKHPHGRIGIQVGGMIYGWRQPGPQKTRRPQCPIGIFLSVCCRSFFRSRSGRPSSGNPARTLQVLSVVPTYNGTGPEKLYAGLRHSGPGVLANGRNPRPDYVSKGNRNL